MNAIILAVLVMLILAMLRVHVVLSLFVGALAGGLSAGLGISRTMVAFQDGLAAGAKIALSYALLGGLRHGGGALRSAPTAGELAHRTH